MKIRKTIAVVAADVYNEYINKILSGITKQANALGYDVGVFMMTFNKDSDTWLQVGEENIYNLLNADAIDAAVFIGGNIVSKTLVKKLEQLLQSLGIPFIAVDCESDVCESINALDTDLFELMTDHFIQYHKCREIMCFTGFEGNPQAESRLAGYRRSLEKHGIPIRDELIVYGDFWKTSAIALAEEFISGTRKLPDAVVCANDLMAIYLCNHLENNGIQVPENVMISGYDGSQDAIDNVPSITTIFPLNENLGARAVLRLHKMITGEDAEIIDTAPGHIIPGQSCGCDEDSYTWSITHESYINNIKNFDAMYRSSGMTEKLLEAQSLEELIKLVNNFCYLINGLDHYMLCLCENWDNLEQADSDDYLKEGYAENMHIKMIRVKDKLMPADFTFKSSEIFPEKLHELVPEPSAYFFLPMHFKDRCFGYSIFKFNNIRRSLSALYATWCRNINIALEFLRVRTQLMCINQRIFVNSIRDTLTGIYNHKGFKRFSDTIFKTAISEQKKLLIVVADLDMLKYINDNFGHVEGDVAITVAADILNKCCQNNEICARIGGDEYTIVGCFDYTDEIIESYITYINDYFERYNATSGKPYPVGASIGIYCDVPAEGVTFQDCFSIADKRMYQNKFERKKMRTN